MDLKCPFCGEPLEPPEYIHKSCISYEYSEEEKFLRDLEYKLFGCYKGYICYDNPVPLLRKIRNPDDEFIESCILDYAKLIGISNNNKDDNILENVSVELEFGNTKEKYPGIGSLLDIAIINHVLKNKLNNKCPLGFSCKNRDGAISVINKLTAYLAQINDIERLKLIIELYKLHGEIEIATRLEKYIFNIENSE